jgi:hypothetical protein
MAVVLAGRLHQPLDLPLGQVLAGSVVAVRQSTARLFSFQWSVPCSRLLCSSWFLPAFDGQQVALFENSGAGFDSSLRTAFGLWVAATPAALYQSSH